MKVEPLGRDPRAIEKSTGRHVVFAILALMSLPVMAILVVLVSHQGIFSPPAPKTDRIGATENFSDDTLAVQDLVPHQATITLTIKKELFRNDPRLLNLQSLLLDLYPLLDIEKIRALPATEAVVGITGLGTGRLFAVVRLDKIPLNAPNVIREFATKNNLDLVESTSSDQTRFFLRDDPEHVVTQLSLNFALMGDDDTLDAIYEEHAKLVSSRSHKPLPPPSSSPPQDLARLVLPGSFGPITLRITNDPEPKFLFEASVQTEDQKHEVEKMVAEGIKGYAFVEKFWRMASTEPSKGMIKKSWELEQVPLAELLFLLEQHGIAQRSQSGSN